ncbi:Peroxiredoxin [Maridesulfovibrio ferrireducens]|uniref:Peroxiredoxin n=1 Tax=Maridesulfovibrio ferrireducens TaxID=246191 RepID=A0A1G9FUH5_9BACT|nr:TlpA disulfide reductase family protein [Maridesulfovibrio ferrireducens]SDK92040.1 Peroxiredoxin [Maridesulfovibrio ferrireducens]
MFRYLSSAILTVFLFAGAAFAEPMQKGENFPDITLTGNQTAVQLSYLGLSGNGPWQLKDIDADFVIIEIFSMYCPHCQAEAPSVNKLFAALKKSKSNARIKLIGVGVGNSDFEVNFFRKKYQIEFPLFDDLDFKIYEEVGKPGTPHFFMVDLKDKNKLKTVSSFAGRMKDPKKFLISLQKAAD